jgi:signal transduction histidine kinase
MAAEVAVQQLKGIRETLKDEGDSLDEWLTAAQLPTIDWQNTEQRLSWPDYVRILDIVSEKRPKDWLTQRGADSIFDEDAMLFRNGLLLGFDRAGAALEWMCMPAGPFSAVSPFLHNELEKKSDSSYTLRSVMASGLEPCRSHHHFCCGILQEFPTVLFEREARVELEYQPDGAVYQIEFSQPSLFGGWRRRIRRSRPQPDYLSGIGETYNALVQRQIELQKQQALVRNAEIAALRAEKQESLGSLTSGVAHDFRNLLTVAQGQLELMLTELDANHRRRVEQVLATCHQGSELAGRLLAYVREAPAATEQLCVQDVLTSVLPILERGLGSKSELKIVVPDAPQQIRAERGQLENALLNLVVNASDAIPESGTVTITSQDTKVSEGSCLAQGCDPGEYVRISVEDTGIGIDPDLAKLVFDPYFTTKANGTGLGLSSVWGFVKQSGGHITVTSNIDQGCRFDMFLPKH